MHFIRIKTLTTYFTTTHEQFLASSDHKKMVKSHVYPGIFAGLVIPGLMMELLILDDL